MYNADVDSPRWIPGEEEWFHEFVRCNIYIFDNLKLKFS